jgi:ADP-heptose:LPS heptosyltransferase
MVHFKIHLLPDLHIVDRYFKALTKLKIHNDGQGLDHFIPPDEEVDISVWIPGHQKEYIAFSIGGKHNTKILPEELITALCKEIETPVILLGGPEDKERGERITKNAGTHVINACGALSINQSASVIRQSQKVITHDTGLMHIAAAFRKPILSIWGNTIPAFGMVPYLPEELKKSSRIFEVKDLLCRPCSKIGFDQCPKKHFRCMKDQDLGGIIDALKS